MWLEEMASGMKVSKRKMVDTLWRSKLCSSALVASICKKFYSEEKSEYYHCKIFIDQINRYSALGLIVKISERNLLLEKAKKYRLVQRYQLCSLTNF
jgi:hypothetical protein